MRALAVAAEYWGGSGCILVPFDPLSGDPADAMADAVRAFDPDHVVSLRLSFAEWEELYPGTIEIDGVVDEAERLRMIQSTNLNHVDQAAEVARSVVASWCSPLRMARVRGESGPSLEVLKSLGRVDTSRPSSGPIAPAPATHPDLSMVASAHWRTDQGLLAALRLGVTADFPGRREPSTDVLTWLIDSDQDLAPSPLRAGDLTSLDAPQAYWADQGIVRVGRGHTQDGSVIVVGDTAEDYALALAYDRLVGNAIWLTSDLLEDDEIWNRRIRPGVQSIVFRLESQGRRLAVTSASLEDLAMQVFVERLQGADIGLVAPSQEDGLDSRPRTIQLRRPSLASGLTSLLVDEHIGATVSLPVTTELDGSKVALFGLDTPIPAKLLFPPSSPHVPYWYVDVSVSGDATPRARDAPIAAMPVDNSPFPAVNLRASKEGVSFSPRYMGFVASGSLLTSRIGRPRVNSRSMMAWVRAMASRDNLDVRLSDAGRRAELVRSRLGTRQEFLDFASPANLSALRAFVPRDRKPKPSERDPDTVVIGVDPYLSFPAIQQRMPQASATEALDLVDRLAAARLLRRGLILGCEDCGRPSFVYAERLGPTYECTQCSALNSLVSASWKRVAPEPTWFYDLHPNFRELLEANGDVVLLASAHIRSSGREYVDAPELEFVDRDSGLAIAEIDVVACVEDQVVIAEAKANGKFDAKQRGAKAAKLLRVASALRADRILLATTADSWNALDVTHMEHSASKLLPFPATVDVIASLGSG